jgi:hypothetical protein
LDHVCSADVVFVGPGEKQFAGVGETGILRAVTFSLGDEGTVTAVVDAVMEGGADRAVSFTAASAEDALEITGYRGPNRGTGGVLARSEAER